MDVGAAAGRLRAFNRFYTQQIGVVSDRYLGQDRPLSESRLLFEIGDAGCTVRELRTRLVLDSGQLSRLLRSLEAQRLIRVQPDAADKRVRLASLTSAGRRALATLNAKADESATTVLRQLDDRQRTDLLSALDNAARLLRLAGVTLTVVDPTSTEAQLCLQRFSAELEERFPEGFDRDALVPPRQASGKDGAFVVARERERLVGCGVLRTLEPGIGEIRHLWVTADARGIGLGRRLLSELESQALTRGHTAVRLDTHEVLTEAIQLYRTAGYEEITPYDDNPYAHLWFDKPLRVTSHDVVGPNGPA